MRRSVAFILLLVSLVPGAAASDLTCLRYYIPGEGKPVHSVALSPDGGLVAAADDKADALVWDGRTGAEVEKFKETRGKGRRVAFSPDGSRLVSGLADGRILLWETEGWTPAGGWERHDGPVMALAFAPGGGKAASGGDDRMIRIHDPATGACLLRLQGHRRAVHALAFTPDGATLVTGGDDTVRVWDLTSGKQVRELSPGEGTAGATALAVSPDGRLVAAGHPGKASATLWELSTGKPLARLVGHELEVSGIQFAAEGRHVLTASVDGSVRTWDVADGREVSAFRAHLAPALSLAVSADGSRAASGGQDGEVVVWADGNPIGYIRSHHDRVSALGFTPDGAQMSAALRGRKAVWRSWPAEGGELRDEDLSRLSGVEHRAYSADGRYWALANQGGVSVSKRGEAGWSKPVWLDPTEGNVIGIGFSPDGGTLYVATDARNPKSRIQFWDTERGTERESIANPTDFASLRRFVVSHDGRHGLATTSKSGIVLYDLAERRVLWQRVMTIDEKGQEAYLGAIDIGLLGGGRVAVVGGQGLQVWEAATARLVSASWRDAGWFPQRLATSPDGRFLAIGGSWKVGGRDYRGARVWSVGPDGTLSRAYASTANSESDSIHLAFAPDGRSLAAGDDRGLVRVWSIGRGARTETARISPKGSGPPREVAETMALMADPERTLESKVRAVISMGERFGPRAAAAVPALTTLYRQARGGQRFAIVATLAEIKGPAIPQLISLVDDPEVGTFAIERLRQIGPEAEGAGDKMLDVIAAKYRNPLPVEPAYLKHLVAAISSLHPLGVDARRAVPVLCGLLDRPQRSPQGLHLPWLDVADEAINQLKKYGPEARDAVPTMIRLIREPLAKKWTNMITLPIEALGTMGPEAASALPVLRAIVAPGSGFTEGRQSEAEAAIRLITLGER